MPTITMGPKRDSATTSRIMAAVRGQNGTAEMAVRRRLWINGLRYRVRSRLAGKPDVVFPSKHIAVFIDGDFWHGNSWRLRGLPSLSAQFSSRPDWWVAKITRNIERDTEVTAALTAGGWTVLRYWESEVLSDPNGITRQIAERVRGQPPPSWRDLETTATERRRLASITRAATRHARGAVTQDSGQDA